MPILVGEDAKKNVLQLLQDDDCAESFNNVIKINHGFAKAFEERKRREELQQLAAKYDKDYQSDPSDQDNSEDESSSSSGEEEDSPTNELSTDVELLCTLAKIRAKDATIYNSKSKFYSEENFTKTIPEKKDKENSLFLKEYSHNILTSGSYLNNSDDEQKQPQSYSNEQEALRSAVVKAATIDTNEDDLFSEPKKESQLSNEKEYAQLVIEALSKEKHVQETMKAWITTPMKKKSNQAESKTNVSSGIVNEDAGDEFLASYILNRGWTSGIKKAKVSLKEELNSDIEEVENAEEFETAFNRRFEDSMNSTQIVGHSRINTNLIRENENSRKNSRKAKIEKKEKKTKSELEELKRLKSLKRQEIEAFGEKIVLLSGHLNSNEKVSGFLETLYKDDESSFDEEKHDAHMASLFDDEYYQAKELLDPKLFIPDNEGNNIDELENKAMKKNEKKTNPKRKDHVKDSQKEPSNTAFNLKEQLLRLEDEYYNLHYEDKIAGGLATRFKYKNVIPTSYGLDINDIISSEDKRLNKYVSLKKLRPYRDQDEQKKDIEKYSRRKVVKRFYYDKKKSKN